VYEFSGCRSLLLFLLLLQAGIIAGKLRLKLLDTSASIEKSFLSRIERMADAANVDNNFFACAAGGKRIAATAFNDGFFVFWVDIFSHRSRSKASSRNGPLPSPFP